MEKLNLLWNYLFFMAISNCSVVRGIIGPTKICNSIATCREGNSWRCRCDSLCDLHKDCCIDIYRGDEKLDVDAGVKFSCLPLVPSESIYAVDSCLKSWIGSVAVRKNCEISNDFSDPLMFIPVTDIMTGITYRNRYCAECNGFNSDDLQSWFVILTCNSLLDVQREYKNVTQNFILQNIIRIGNIWGVYHWNQSYRSMSFFQCDISFSLPNYLSRYVRRCYMDMVSECAFDWKDEVTRQLCKFYMSTVFDVNGQLYRNVHCAKCNYVPMNNIECYVGVFEFDIPVYGNDHPTLNFAILVDVNPNDGNKVGLKSPCSSNQIFDPFTKQCRSLVCAIPGSVRKGNKCIRQ